MDVPDAEGDPGAPRSGPAPFTRWEDLPLWLRARDVAKITGETIAAIYMQAQRGTIPCVRRGKSVRFLRDEIRAWIQGDPKLRVTLQQSFENQRRLAP